MKALSIHPYFANGILYGYKTVENRSWTTKYRGDILICSTAKKYKNTIPGHAICVANLQDIEPFTEEHLYDADMYEYDPNTYAWLLNNIRAIKPFPVKGKLSLWECDHEIEYLDISANKIEQDKLLENYYKPLLYTGKLEQW